MHSLLLPLVECRSTLHLHPSEWCWLREITPSNYTSPLFAERTVSSLYNVTATPPIDVNKSNTVSLLHTFVSNNSLSNLSSGRHRMFPSNNLCKYICTIHNIYFGNLSSISNIRQHGRERRNEIERLTACCFSWNAADGCTQISQCPISFPLCNFADSAY